jgi:hypothetical protein
MELYLLIIQFILIIHLLFNFFNLLNLLLLNILLISNYFKLFIISNYKVDLDEKQFIILIDFLIVIYKKIQKLLYIILKHIIT